jgi:outer membrane protein TolC
MIRQRIRYFTLLLLTLPVSGSLWGQSPDSLSHYLEVAAQNNPEVKAGFLAYQASLQQVPQAGAYQDPQMEIGYFLKPMDIIDGRQVANIQLMQMFPWFGTKKAAQTEATHMARMAYEQFRETRDNLYLNVHLRWFTLCRLQQKLVNSRENKELLAQLEELALRKLAAPARGGGSAYSLPAPTNRSSTPSGSGGGMSMNGSANPQSTPPASDSNMSSMGTASEAMNGASQGMSGVLRIRLDRNELDSNIESLLSELQAEKAGFNALLNRPAGSEIIIPDSLGQMPLPLDAASAMARIAAQNPMLGMIHEEGLAYKAKAEMDRKMSYPMLGIGLQYTFINKSKPAASTAMAEPGMNNGEMNSMNGKDMIMPMLSLSIPIYRSKYKAQQRESSFRQQESQEKYINTLHTLEAEWYKTKHQLDDASRKITLYKKQAELARATYSLTVQEFISGTGDLANVIQVQRQLLDYQLKTAEATADYNTMVASIHKLISEPTRNNQ